MELSEPLDQLDDEKNLNYYRIAGNIAAKILGELVEMSKPGVKVVDMCTRGDNMILEEVNKVLKKIKDKGIAFPTSVSINEMAGFYSPEKDDKTAIKDGDIVKIELGVHVNGFPALVCFTVVVNESGEKISDRRADVVKAAIEASRNIVSVMKPGNTNNDIVKIMNDVSKKYNCNLPIISENIHAPGVVSYQISRCIVDGYNEQDDEFIHRFILNRASDSYDFGMRNLELEENEVYAIDVLMSTGTGKLTRADTSVNTSTDNSSSCTIYKRLVDKRVNLKMKTSRATLSSFGQSRFPMNVKDKEPRFKFGLKECIQKGVIEEYFPIREKVGEYVARVKFTVIVKDKPILIIGRSGSKELEKLSN